MKIDSVGEIRNPSHIRDKKLTDSWPYTWPDIVCSKCMKPSHASMCQDHLSCFFIACPDDTFYHLTVCFSSRSIKGSFIKYIASLNVGRSHVVCNLYGYEKLKLLG